MDQVFTTPPSEPSLGVPGENKRKRSPNSPSSGKRSEVERSASPSLAREPDMKRTPQHGMAQSRLIATGGSLGLNTANHGAATAGTAPIQGEVMEIAGGQPLMGAASAAPVLGNQAPGEPLTAEFFKNLIGENTKMITGKIDKLTTDLITLTSSVESNRAEIAKLVSATERQGTMLEAQKA